MSIGISDWVEMEQQPREAAALWSLTTMANGSELTTTYHGSEADARAVLLENFGPEPFDPTLVYEIDNVGELAENSASPGQFAVVTMSDDGEESTHYFRTHATALRFAGQTSDQVIAFDGLMD